MRRPSPILCELGASAGGAPCAVHLLSLGSSLRAACAAIHLLSRGALVRGMGCRSLPRSESPCTRHLWGWAWGPRGSKRPFLWSPTRRHQAGQGSALARGASYPVGGAEFDLPQEPVGAGRGTGPPRVYQPQHLALRPRVSDCGLDQSTCSAPSRSCGWSWSHAARHAPLSGPQDGESTKISGSRTKAALPCR